MKGFALSDRPNRQTGETKQIPPAGSCLFGLFGFSETSGFAVTQGRETICGLFGLFGWK